MNDEKIKGGAALDDFDDALNVSALDMSSLENLENKAPDSSVSDSAEEMLDLEALAEYGDDSGDGATSSEIKSSHGEALFGDTVAMLEAKEISFANCVKLLEKSAEDGYVDALIYLGKLYGDKKSCEYAPELSCHYFSKAADGGLGEGYYYLGICYLNGIGCERDEARAVEMMIRGGELGHAPCITVLGICRERGVGCEMDYTMAAKLYERAAEGNDATALNNLGGCYFYGHGVVQDKERAFGLYKRAGELGSLNALCRLGICYEDGEGCERDAASAFECYKTAADGGNEIAIYRLAKCYDNGVGVGQNFAKAYAYYNRAASLGYAPAMYRAGIMSRDGRGTKKNAFTAYKLFSEAAEEGLSDAKYEVGNCYAEGKGTVKNSELAYLRYLEAFESDGTNYKAAFKLGLCNLKGIGTERDQRIALEWFSRGAELGSSSAAYMKGECYFYGVGAQKDYPAAIESYKEAISDKMIGKISVDAYIALAKCLEGGLGCDRNPEAALGFYKLAADCGSAEATYDLGRIMLSGVGALSSATDARTCVLRAARSEHPAAMLAMGIFADEGRGVAKNAQDAERWYTKTVGARTESFPALSEFPERFYERAERASSSKIEAQYRLGILQTKKDPSSRSYISAFENIAYAASMGHAAAQREIVGIYLHGGDLKSYYEFSSGAKSEEPPLKGVLGSAMNKLGDAYFDGKALVKKNEAAAARCYKIAAESGDVDGAYSYGWCLRHGVGLSENDAESVKWLKLAADRGSVNAAYSYGLCCEEGSGTGIKNKREARSYYRKAAAAGHLEAARRYMSLSEK